MFSLRAVKKCYIKYHRDGNENVNIYKHTMQCNRNHIIDCLHTTIHIGLVLLEVSLLHKMRRGNHDTMANKVALKIYENKFYISI